MDDRDWVLIDVETAGLSSPVVVELAAQRMRGWSPQGPAWRRLLNHGPDMNQERSRVHGLSRALIERDGEAPTQVYREWAGYIDGLPLVAFDLPQALHRALQPEWVRLGLAPIGAEGFCALRLAQRLLDPVPVVSGKLQTLRQYYRLPERTPASALGEVETGVTCWARCCNRWRCAAGCTAGRQCARMRRRPGTRHAWPLASSRAAISAKP